MRLDLGYPREVMLKLIVKVIKENLKNPMGPLEKEQKVLRRILLEPVELQNHLTATIFLIMAVANLKRKQEISVGMSTNRMFLCAKVEPHVIDTSACLSTPTVLV